MTQQMTLTNESFKSQSLQLMTYIDLHDDPAIFSVILINHPFREEIKISLCRWNQVKHLFSLTISQLLYVGYK